MTNLPGTSDTDRHFDYTASAPRRRVLLVCILASLAGLMCGMDIGVISGVLGPFGREFHATTFQLEWVVGGMLLGATFGALSGARFCERFGRKYTLTLAAASFGLGAAGCALSTNIPMMIGFRIMVGVGLGLSDFTAPLYLSEIARKEQRGALISTYQLLKTLGIFLTFFTNSWLSASGNWRGMLTVEAAPALFFFLIFMRLPDSPRWLAHHGRYREALETMMTLRDTPETARQELETMGRQEQRRQNGWKLLKENPNFRRSVGLGMIIQVMQQLAGINIIMYYAPRILAAANFGTEAQMWCTAVLGFVNMVMTLVAIRYCDRWGRKPILYAGYGGMAVSMGVLAFILGVGANTFFLQMTALVLMIGFVGAFAMSAGPLAWVICSEIQPSSGRTLGTALSTAANLLANFLIGISFLSLMEFMGSASTFWLFAFFNLFGIIVIYLFVPETKDVALETIEQRLMEGVKLRDLGR